MKTPSLRFTARRAASLLVVVVGASALLFARLTSGPPAVPVTPAAPLAPTAPAEPAGRVLFDRYCGNCHDLEALAAPLRKTADRAGLQARLEEFLRRHGDASDADDRLIVAHLLR